LLLFVLIDISVILTIKSIHMAYNKLNNYLKIAMIIFAMIAVLGFIYRFRDQAYAQMAYFKLVPLKETYTELFFSDPEILPYSAADDNSVSFKFMIRNREGIQMAYHYSILGLCDGMVAKRLGSGAVVLVDDQAQAVEVAADLGNKNTYKKCRVITQLDDFGQQISFLISGSK